MPAEKGRNAALTQEPDPDNTGVGTFHSRGGAPCAACGRNLCLKCPFAARFFSERLFFCLPSTGADRFLF